MGWVYGDILCQTLEGAIAWVYGEILCATTTGESYPSEAVTRVTNLIHRWSPGHYSLVLALGEVTSEFGLPQYRDIPLSAIPPTPPGPPEPPGPPPKPSMCFYKGRWYSEGSYIWDRRARYVCRDGKWEYAPGPEPPPETGGCYLEGHWYPEGTYKVINSIGYVCSGGNWIELPGPHP